MMKKRRISWMLILPIIFIHFMVARPAGFPLTMAPFAIVIFLIYNLKAEIRIRGLVVYLILLIWPFAVFGGYEFLGGDADLLEFFKTYFLWAYAIIAIIVGANSPLRRYSENSREFTVALGFILSFSLAQILLFRLFGSTALYNPFGEFSYMSEYKVERMVGDGFARAPAFFLEPSFSAFMIFFLVAAILIAGGNSIYYTKWMDGKIAGMMRRGRSVGVSDRITECDADLGKNILKMTRTKILMSPVWTLVIGMFSVIVSGSATGMLAVGSLIFVYVVTTTVKGGIARLALLSFVPIILAALGSMLLAGRISEIGVEGTSGYWRLIAPLIILNKVFIEYPLGVPFGQIEDFLLPLGLQHGEGVGTSIDNGIYYLAFYFGWLVVPFVVGLFYKILQSVYRADIVGMTFWWFVFLSLQFSGGIILPEYIFPLLLVLLQYRSARYLERAVQRSNV